MTSTDKPYQKGIQEGIFAGLQKQIAHYFGVDAKLTSYADGYEVFSKKQDRAPTYPFGFISLESVSIDEAASYRSHALTNTYLKTNEDQVAGNAVFMTLTPVIFEVVFHYVCTDIRTAVDFAAIWAVTHKKSKLDFKLNYRGTLVTVKVEPDVNISVPKKETPATTAGAMEYEGSLRISGYLSSPRLEDNPTLPVFDSIELSVFVQHTDEEKGKGGTLDYSKTIKRKTQ